MPLGPGVRYRWKTFPSGKSVRLAFKNHTVVEVKPKGGQAKMIKRSLKGSPVITETELARGYRRLP